MTLEVTTIDEAIEHSVDLINGNRKTEDGFTPDSIEKTVALANSLIDKAGEYTGPQAATTAIKLAAHRYKIGLAAQYWKIEAARTKKLSDRLIKDSLMVAFTGLEEMINTLKLTARTDINLANSR